MHRNEGFYKPGTSLLEFVFLIRYSKQCQENPPLRADLEFIDVIAMLTYMKNIYTRLSHDGTDVIVGRGTLYDSLLDETVCLGCGPLPVTVSKSWQMKAYRNPLRNM